MRCVSSVSVLGFVRVMSRSAKRPYFCQNSSVPDKFISFDEQEATNMATQVLKVLQSLLLNTTVELAKPRPRSECTEDKLSCALRRPCVLACVRCEFADCMCELVDHDKRHESVQEPALTVTTKPSAKKKTSGQRRTEKRRLKAAEKEVAVESAVPTANSTAEVDVHARVSELEAELAALRAQLVERNQNHNKDAHKEPNLITQASSSAAKRAVHLEAANRRRR